MKLNINNLFSKNTKTSGHLFITVADSPTKQAQGLMFKKHLPEDRGMFFVFSRQQKLNFWGENTFIPLDIAFVDKDGIIKKIDHIIPMSKKIVSSDQQCLYAIEANHGFFKKQNIEVGDKIFINNNSNDEQYLSFSKKRRNNSKNEIIQSRRLLAQNDLDISQINELQKDMTQDQNLPILNLDDLSNILEDDIEDQELALFQDEKAQPGVEAKEPPLDVNTEPEQPDFKYPHFNNIFDAAAWAEQNNETIRISYTTNKGNKIIRDIEPHGTFHAKTTNREILVTFDQTVGDIRAFVMLNIGTFSFVGERFIKKFRVV